MAWTGNDDKRGAATEREFRLKVDGHEVPGVYWEPACVWNPDTHLNQAHKGLWLNTAIEACSIVIPTGIFVAVLRIYYEN